MSAPATGTPTPGMRRLLITEAKLYLREPALVLWTLAFPPALLIIFGSIPSFREPSSDVGGLRPIDLYVPIIIGLVLAMTAVNALPATLASYRERGILRRLSTTPLSPARLLLVQVLLTLAVEIVVLVLVLGIGRVAFDVPLPARPLGYAAGYLLAVASLFGIGLLIAAVARTGRAANAIGMVLFAPMMFFAGLWLPRAAMPELLRRISDATPLGAAVQALHDSSVGLWPQPLHLAVMAGYAVLFGALAVKYFRWEW